MSDIAPSNALPAFDLDAFSSWVGIVFVSLPADCIKATFQHIGLTSDEISPPPPPYLSTPFPYVHQSDIDDDLEEDCADLQFEA